MPSTIRWLLVAPVLTAALAASCGSDPPDDDGSAVADVSTTLDDGAADTATLPAFEPGKVVIETEEGIFRFIVYDCLIGDETGSPNRRLALSASTTEPFLEADEVLNVDILVSRTGDEEHVVTLTRMSGTNLGASDTGVPSRGGPAPDDWIDVDEDARVVTGSGFELRATGLGDDGETMGVGRLIADCSSDGTEGA